MLDQFRLVADERFVEFRPSGDDLKLASDRSEEMGILPNSYTRGAGRMLGLLGEIAVEKYLDGLATNCSSRHYGYDLITESGITIEVKTKRSRGIPKLDYTASVEKKKTHMFENDLFVFLRGTDSYAKLWMLGWIKTDSFKRRAEFRKKGESDETGFAHAVDGYHIPIKKLKRITELEDFLLLD
jgi:hypothetical protein